MAKQLPKPQIDNRRVNSFRFLVGQFISRVDNDFSVAENHNYFVGDSRLLTHNTAKTCFPNDFATKNTKQLSSTMNSEREARALAREKVGKNPIDIGDNKLRSQNGKWQYRAKPIDYNNRHVHIERLNPQTGEVLYNWHLNW